MIKICLETETFQSHSSKVLLILETGATSKYFPLCDHRCRSHIGAISSERNINLVKLSFLLNIMSYKEDYFYTTTE